ncbi:hypothetical protein Tco_0030760 [Tanacetum coccineum]
MTYTEQTHCVDYPDDEIHSDSNIISYSQYLQESQNAGIPDTNSSAPNDLLVLSFAAFQQEIDTLKDTLSKNVKEKESLLETLTVFKTESKEKESKYVDKEIVLKKQNKELENVICKMYRSAQAMHMLTKPQVFYDDTHKQALGYQDPFYLKKAQRIKPTLYDGSVIAKEHDVISVIDNDETLNLEEESRSKMNDKQNDPISIEKKIKISLTDYSKLNNIKEDFGKRFVTQKELSAEQAFWLKHSNHSFVSFAISQTPVKIEAPRELPKVSLVNESLKKLRYQLASFDKVVTKRTTSDAITADEITEVQSVFNQMESVVDQCSVDKNDFEIQTKQLRIDNDQLLNQIMSQDIMHIAMNSVDILDVNMSCVNDCCKCLELETKLLKKEDFVEKEAYDKLVKSYSTLEKHCISLELATQLNQEIFQKENSGSVENLDLNAQLQEKVFAITALKNELRKLKGKIVVDTAVSKPFVVTIAPGMYKLDIELISPKLKNHRDAHADYLQKTIENTDTLRDLVECARNQNPSESLLDYACKYTKHVQELLVYASKTCPIP